MNTIDTTMAGVEDTLVLLDTHAVVADAPEVQQTAMASAPASSPPSPPAVPNSTPVSSQAPTHGNATPIEGRAPGLLINMTVPTDFIVRKDKGKLPRYPDTDSDTETERAPLPSVVATIRPPRNDKAKDENSAPFVVEDVQTIFTTANAKGRMWALTVLRVNGVARRITVAAGPLQHAKDMGWTQPDDKDFDPANPPKDNKAELRQYGISEQDKVLGSAILVGAVKSEAYEARRMRRAAATSRAAKRGLLAFDSLSNPFGKGTAETVLGKIRVVAIMVVILCVIALALYSRVAAQTAAIAAVGHRVNLLLAAAAVPEAGAAIPQAAL